ncbi:MAG: 50S ribosomal protein L37e [Candidatus Bathyarchaeota archaeon]
MGKVSKGTSSFGKRAHKTLHIKCRRCGRRSYHVNEKRCSACGYGQSPKIRKYSWQTKTLNGSRLT